MSGTALADQGQLIDVACALCGSSERRERFREGPYAVVTCGRCGLTYVTPRLSERALIERVYDEGYWRSQAARARGYTDYRGDADLYLRTYRLRRKLLQRRCARVGRLLDVGCAAGYFLRVMREVGWDVWGFEPSEPIRTTAVQELGAERVRGGALESAGFEPESFDLVTLWDVLEHTPDPLGTLRTCAGLLRRDGQLLIETQDVASFTARLLGRRWQHYKHAEHLFHFEARTLARALELAGLREIWRTARYAGKYVSPHFIAERAARLHPLFSRVLLPLARLGPRGVYVNPFDELIVMAERR